MVIFIAIINTACSSNLFNKTYKINTSFEGQGEIKKNPNNSRYDENSEVTLKAIPKSDWIFSHWEGAGFDNNENDEITVIVKDDIKIKAHFKQDYNINKEVEGEGSIETKVVEKSNYSEGTTVELKANADTNWAFSHWEGDIEGDENPKNITMDDNKEIIAVFKQHKFSLNINTSGEGSVSKEVVYTPNNTYEKHTEIELKAEPSDNYTFSHWEGDIEETENPTIIKMDSDKNVTAVFNELGQINGKVNIYNRTEVDTSNLSNIKTNKINQIDKSSYKEGEVIVKYPNNTNSQSIMSIAESHNMQIKNSLDTENNKFVLYKLKDGQSIKETISKLNSLTTIEWAEPNYIHHISAIPNDPDYNTKPDFSNQQWGPANLNLEAAWDIEKGSSSVKIAVVDTGVLPNHPDLQDNLLQGADFVGGEEGSSPQDYNITDEDPTDPTNQYNGGSHGTHVTGIIGADTNNNEGVAGAMWDVEISPVRVMGTDGVGSNWDIAEGVYYAIDNGADIINLSLGRPAEDGRSYLEEDYVDKAKKEDVLIFAATGNEYENQINYPAKYEDVIAVGSTNIDNKISEYSNTGEVDIVAPGGDGEGFIHNTWGYYSNDGDSVTHKYTGLAGTSMATPYASGVAGLLIANGVHPREVKERLINTTVDLGDEGYDETYGYGLIDAYGALLNKKLPSPTVFAGTFDSDTRTIYLKSEIVDVYDFDSYALNNIEHGESKFFAWRDINENGIIDSGDYFGQTDTSYNIESDTKLSDIDIDISYLSKDFNSISIE